VVSEWRRAAVSVERKFANEPQSKRNRSGVPFVGSTRMRSAEGGGVCSSGGEKGRRWGPGGFVKLGRHESWLVRRKCAVPKKCGGALPECGQGPRVSRGIRNVVWCYGFPCVRNSGIPEFRTEFRFSVRSWPRTGKGRTTFRERRGGRSGGPGGFVRLGRHESWLVRRKCAGPLRCGGVRPECGWVCGRVRGDGVGQCGCGRGQGPRVKQGVAVHGGRAGGPRVISPFALSPG